MASDRDSEGCVTRRSFLKLVAAGTALSATGAWTALSRLAADAGAPQEHPAARCAGRAIAVEAEDRFRATAACLLLTPYGELRSDRLLPHPLRTETLALVQAYRDHPCAEFFRQHIAGGNFGGQFYSLSAWLTPTAPFRWTGKQAEMEASNLPPPVKRYLVDDRYPELLTSFVTDAKLPQFWRTTAGEWEGVCWQCSDSLARYGVQDWLASFWGPSPKRLVLVPNPTDPPQCGFGPSTTREAFSIVGPPAVLKDAPPGSPHSSFAYGQDSELASTTVHEFGHTYIGVAREQIHALAKDTEEFGRSLQFRGNFADYGEWPMELEEAILTATQGVWQAERDSRAAADDVIAWQVNAYNLTILPAMYQALLEARKGGRTLGAAAVVECAGEAVKRLSRSSASGSRADG
jgi:Domain of unknown function (DUF4932)